MDGSELRDLGDIPQGEELLIYGAGGAGARLLQTISNERGDLRVLAFVDSFKDGGMFCDRPVVNVDRLQSEFRGRRILVASIYHKQIVAALRERDIENYSIYFKYFYEPETYKAMCELADPVRESRIITLTRPPALAELEGAALVFNLPVRTRVEDVLGAQSAPLRALARHDPAMATSVRDLDLTNVEACVEKAATSKVCIVDIDGDQMHLTRLTRRFAAVPGLQVWIYKKTSPRKCAVVVDDLQLAYIPFPKCGSTSVINLLRGHFEKGFDENKGEHYIQTANSIVYHADVQKLQRQRYDMFVVSRSPYARLASLYNSIRNRNTMLLRSLKQVKGSVSFATFCRFVANCPDELADNHFRSQTSFMRLPGRHLCDAHVIPIEEFQERLPAFLSHYCPDFSQSHRNRSRSAKQDYLREYYTPELIELVNRRYEEDFVTFSYDFL